MLAHSFNHELTYNALEFFSSGLIAWWLGGYTYRRVQASMTETSVFYPALCYILAASIWLAFIVYLGVFPLAKILTHTSFSIFEQVTLLSLVLIAGFFAVDSFRILRFLLLEH